VTLHDLPASNAFFNGLAGVFLAFGYYFVKRGKVIAHRNCMIAAVCSSALFLTGYLTYHIVLNGGVTRFQNPVWFRPIYLTILITHLILAVAILPMIIITLTFALRQRFDKHKRIARWTWPLWMYVSVTGVLIYLLLYQIFPQHQPESRKTGITQDAIVK
jgi:putative membrane protein